jgi:hypothetical protein
MRDEFALDALVDYHLEDDDPEREVPNPRWAALDAELRAAKAEFQRVSARYGVAAIGNEERARPTTRKFKIANAAAGRLLAAPLKRCIDLENRRAKVPCRVPVHQTDTEAVRLAAETQHLTSVLKMVAYQAESELARQLAPHYRRSEDEGRTLVQTALASAADLEVTNRELRVRLAPLSSPHRTRAVAALCQELDRAAVRFPGTDLRVRYSIRDVA